MPQRTKILVVEDNANVAEVLKFRLEYMGYEVCDVAPSGPKALASITHTMPDLILMDIFLEDEMDGIETAAEIGKQTDTPVIYLSCLRDPDVLKRALQTKPFGYLVKPYDKTELQMAIEIALSKYRAAKAQDNPIKRSKPDINKETVQTLSKRV